MKLLSESRLRELADDRPDTCSLYEVRRMAYEVLQLRSAVQLFVAWHEMDHDGMEPSEIQKRYDEAINAAKAAATWMGDGE